MSREIDAKTGPRTIIVGRIAETVGIRNSSLTRVVPVFDRLLAADPVGGAWLPGLLKLGSRATEVRLDTITPRLVADHVATWGKGELALSAPLGLLEFLVQTVTPAQVAASGDKGDVLAYRQQLARRNPKTVAEALRGLRSGSRGRHWYVLEGKSKPDATLEMLSAVLVIEGKRTERSCTSKTKWMGERSQLIRHMDGALEHYPGKRVLGLLLVEGDGGPEASRPTRYWLSESAAQYEPRMLASSLPHRTQEERVLLASGILGVATWQSVCAENRLPWPPVQDSA